MLDLKKRDVFYKKILDLKKRDVFYKKMLDWVNNLFQSEVILNVILICLLLRICL